MANVTINNPQGIKDTVPKFSVTGSALTVNSAIVDVAGKVGIGVPAPASNLDVNGTIRLGGTAPVPGVSVNAAGNVGIGIAAPGAKLDVSGSIQALLSILALNGLIGRSTNPATPAGVFDAAAGGKILSGQVGGAEKFSVDGMGKVVADGGIQFSDGSVQTTAATGGGGSSVISESGGMVGIGTTNPMESLEVAGYARIEGLNFRKSEGVVCRDARITVSNAPLSSHPQLQITGAGDDERIPRIGLYGDTYINSKLYVSGVTTLAGNVGIGTSDPKVPLQIRNGGVIYLHGLPGARVYFFNDETTDWALGTDNGEHSQNFNLHNYGLGLTALSVNRATNHLTAFGGVTAPYWITSSSKRWKTNIRTIKDALSKVKRLRGISYNQKEDDKRTIGLVAEEVGEVIPEIVTYEENSKDARGLDYSRLVAVLIEAVKEQQGQIEELKDNVKSLLADKSKAAGLA